MHVRGRNLPEGLFDERERWPVERWQRFQWRRLQGMVRYAYQNLPFYRRRFDAMGIKPQDIRHPQDFTQLPIFRKAEVMAALREANSYAIGMESHEPTGPKVLGMTSGTVGTAFLFFPARWRQAWGRALARAYWWAGLRPGMTMMTAAPGWHSLAVQESWAIRRLGVHASIPWGTFLPRFAEGFLNTLSDLKPSFVAIFLPMLYAVLAECRRRSLSPQQAFASVASVLAVGAPMTPQGRQHLQEELGVKELFEGAGNPEGLIAMECTHHCGHHYFADVCYVEIVEPTTQMPLPPGHRGSVVISSLIRHGSLHLRYDTEDVGEIFPDPCPCGRTWPLLEVYDRRANLFWVGGRELAWYDVRQCLDELPELVGVPCAVIRRPGGAPQLRLVMQRPPSVGVAALHQRLHELVAAKLQVPLHLEWVNELPTRWKGVAVVEEKDWQVSHV